MKNKLRKVFRDARMFFLRLKYNLKGVHKTFYLGGKSSFHSECITEINFPHILYELRDRVLSLFGRFWSSVLIILV